jgi:fluoride ion exporter CrcB/FEX
LESFALAEYSPYVLANPTNKNLSDAAVMSLCNSLTVTVVQDTLVTNIVSCVVMFLMISHFCKVILEIVKSAEYGSCVGAVTSASTVNHSSLTESSNQVIFLASPNLVFSYLACFTLAPLKSKSELFKDDRS